LLTVMKLATDKFKSRGYEITVWQDKINSL
jgi:hypothetical protein